MNFFVHLKVENETHLRVAEKAAERKGTGVLFVPNHSSELDFIFASVSVPPTSPHFPMYYVAMTSSRYVDVRDVGWRRYVYSLPFFLAAWGAISYRSGTHNYADALQAHVELLRSGRNVCIFPEGKFSHDPHDTNYVAHGGALYLAEKTGAPILPVHVSGAHGVSFGNMFLRKNHARVAYGEPMYAEDLLHPEQPVPQKYKSAALELMKNLYKL